MKRLIAIFLMILISACASQNGSYRNPSVKQYTLDNGFNVVFFPSEKAGLEMRLIVHSGSLQENEQQLGLAHFVEHMAFKGTLHFPNKSSFKNLEQYGIRLGSHINAATSFNSTVYKLSLPDDVKAINLGLQVLSDWAYNISFNEQDFDSERNVIVEEWRLRQGVAYRINSQLDDLRYAGSRYAKRDPIGQISIVKNSPIEAAKSFYEQWYQPQRMSLVIVGSFDQHSMKQAVEKLFGQQPKGQSPQDIPDLRAFSKQTEPLIKTIFDKEQGQRIIQVMLQKNVNDLLNTRVGMSDDIVDQIWLYILNQRFNLLIENQKIQMVKSQDKSILFDQTRQQYTFFAIPKQNDYQHAVDLIFTELQRLATVPVTSDEFIEAKDVMLTKLTQQARNEGNYANNYLADQITTALEYQLPIMSKKQQLHFTQNTLANLTIDKLKQTVNNRLSSSELRVAIIGPLSDKETITKNQILQSWNKIRSDQQLGDFPYQKQEIKLDITPASTGKIIQSENIKAIKSERLILSNGMQVILHQDKKLTDNIQIKLRIPGGQSLDNDQQLGLSTWAQQIANASSNDKVNMPLLRQKQIELSPYTELLFHGFQGSAPEDQLALLFKLIYLKVVDPIFDSTKLSAAKQNAQLVHSNQPVERKFLDFIHKKSFNNSSRLVIEPNGAWNHFTLEQLQTKYQQLYASPKSMVVTISGDFNRSHIKKLVETWLASIPDNHKAVSPQQWKNNNVTPINQSMQHHYPYGTSDKTMVSILYSSDATWQQSDQLALSLLDSVVNLRLRTIIREQHSGVYTIIFSEQLLKNPTAYYLARLNFTTDPKRAQEITNIVNQTMENIKKHGITSKELIQAKQAWKVDYEQNQKSSQYWVNAIAQTASDDQHFEQLVEQNKIINSITLEQVNQLANKFIGKNKKEFMLLPKTTKN